MTYLTYPKEIIFAKSKIRNFSLAENNNRSPNLIDYCEGIEAINNYHKSEKSSQFNERLINMKIANIRKFRTYVAWLYKNNIFLSPRNIALVVKVILLQTHEISKLESNSRESTVNTIKCFLDDYGLHKLTDQIVSYM